MLQKLLKFYGKYKPVSTTRVDNSKNYLYSMSLKPLYLHWYDYEVESFLLYIETISQRQPGIVIVPRADLLYKLFPIAKGLIEDLFPYVIFVVNNESSQMGTSSRALVWANKQLNPFPLVLNYNPYFFKDQLINKALAWCFRQSLIKRKRLCLNAQYTHESIYLHAAGTSIKRIKLRTFFFILAVLVYDLLVIYENKNPGTPAK